jgi:TonB family protein
MATANNFQLGLLPERKLDWRNFVASYGIVALLILIMLSAGLLMPQRLQLSQYHITEIIPLPSNHRDIPKPKKLPPPKILAKLLTPDTPKLIVPREVRQPKVETVIQPPKVMVDNFKPVVLKEVAAIPAVPKVIHTGEFGSSATPTVSAPVQKVQTGGFGDPNGLKGQGKEGAHLIAAATGSFDLPTGPGTGNGTGGAKGIKGTIASAGFGNGIAQTAQTGRAGTVQTAGFGSQQLAQGIKAQRIDTGAPTSGVEITFKPNPVYTDEARALKLEGEVLLEVLFQAGGQLHVNRVVKGLGHGLDEAAMAAANKIRFKPALRNGSPMDSTAIVHVSFQLAY